MHFRKIKKYLLAINLGILGLALPLYWGSSWLQTNIFKDIDNLQSDGKISPLRTLSSDAPLDLQIYDNFQNGNQSKNFQKIVIDRINSAQEKIIIAMYAFDIKEIKEALLKANQRGVKVEFLYSSANKDKLYPFWSDATSSIPPILVGGNIDSKNYSMHHKFLVIDPDTDNRTLLTGSWNWTNLQEDLDPNLLMETHNPEIISSYVHEADQLASGNNGNFKFKLEDFRPWSDLIQFKDAKVEIWFSPGRDKYSIQNRIITMIGSAKSKIDIANTLVDSIPIADSILNKAREGIKIRIIFDHLQVNVEQSIYGYLKKHQDSQKLSNLELVKGGEDKANSLGQYSIFHNHFMVVDDSSVLTGTANWSFGGFFLNDEDFLIISSPSIAQIFANDFDYLFLKYRG